MKTRIPRPGDELQQRDQTIERLAALNRFLERVSGEPTRLSDLLVRAGLSPSDIESLRMNHLDAVIDVVRVGLTTYLLEVLPLKHALVVSQRYRLSRSDQPSLRELAEALDLSRERIRQLQEAGVNRLRSPTRRAAIGGLVARTAIGLQR